MGKTKNYSPVAIVGISAIFPASKSIQSFWSNIFLGKDLIKEVPATYWLKEDYYDPKMGIPDKVYASRGAFLSDIPFDPMEFKIPPQTITSTDTVQLLALVAAKKVLEDARSVQFQKVDRQNISVILGTAAGTEMMSSMASRLQKPTWVKVLRENGLSEDQIEKICHDLSNHYTPWVESTFPGLLSNVVAGRICNRLDLGGTNCVVDSACASSLSALKMAFDELQSGHSELVISGGADAFNDYFMYMCFAQSRALSPSQDCRPFSNKADGTLLGEGLGMVALRRLEDAEKDGDKIYAIVHPVAGSSDGSSKSVYAPLASGQARAIKRVYKKTPYLKEEVELIEGHGTATPAGDVEEFKGLCLAFDDIKRKDKQFCALGSIKSQIGHTKSAAGVASLIKVAMALHHKILPPTIKADRPNSKFKIKESPFYLNTKARPWVHSLDSSRKASLSSFGFGGSNYHVSVEEYTKSANRPRPFYVPEQGMLFLYSSYDKEKLSAKLKNLAAKLKSTPFFILARKSQLEFELNKKYRLGLVVKDDGELNALIDKAINIVKNSEEETTFFQPSLFFSSALLELDKQGQIAFLFPGQGSHYLYMGAPLTMQFEVARSVWDQIAALKFQNNLSLHNVTFPIPAFSEQEKQDQLNLLTGTEWAQPAIGAVSLSYLALLEWLGVKADMTGGHSYGEIPALFAAGVFSSLEDVMKVSQKRGKLMAERSKNSDGAMTAVFTENERLQDYLKKWKSGISIANYNTPKQTVLSGTNKQLEKVEEKLRENSISFRRLPVSTAFHSPIVADSVDPFEKFLKEIKISKPNIPVFSNSSAKAYPKTANSIRKNLAAQLAKPVLFSQQLENMYQAGARIFIEVGPNNILTKLAQSTLPQDCLAVNLDFRGTDDLVSFWSAVGQLAVKGTTIEWKKIWSHFAEFENEQDESGYSKATIKISGINVNKPYPPKGGVEALPKPNENKSDNIKKNSAPANINLLNEGNKTYSRAENETNKINIEKSNLTQPVNQTKINPIEAKRQKKEIEKMPIRDDNWLKAFQSLQGNILEIQKMFHHSLMESNKNFTKMTELAFRQLNDDYQEGRDSFSIYPQEHDQNLLSESLVETPKASGHETAPSIPSPNAAESSFNARPRVDDTKVTSMSPAPGLAPVSSQMFAQPPEMPTSSPPLVTRESLASPLESPDISAETLKALLLEVVARKTGYPEEMLELDIDLESGLGIDSIKRVEILSDFQNKIPELGEIDSAQLAGLNTLGGIIQHIEKIKGGSIAENITPTTSVETKKKTL